VLIASLTDTLAEHPQLVNAAREGLLEGSSGNQLLHQLLMLNQASPGEDMASVYLVTKAYRHPPPTWLENKDPTYSAYNHKRATAAKCHESHHRRTDATTAVPFPDSESAVVSRWCDSRHFAAVACLWLYALYNSVHSHFIMCHSKFCNLSRS
jgi:hypothetical protein